MRRVVLTLSALTAAGLVLTACSGRSSPSPQAHTATPKKVEGGQTVTQYWPLTGLKVRPGQTAKLDHRVLVAKMDNTESSRPQIGLSKADMVVEELVEGGLTRLMAIYQCSTAPAVGPIRSARISDADLLALLHGSVLGFSGANPKDLPPIEAHGDTVLISMDSNPSIFPRNYSRPAPHNVFASTTNILHAGQADRHDLKAPAPLFSYGALDPSAKRAHHISLSWPAASAQWSWDGHEWLRTQDGLPDKLADGTQISTKNIVVLSVDIASTGLRDVLGNASPLDVTVGHNKVWVLRNGRMIAGVWKRPDVTSPLRLVNHQGHVIKLAPGRTWIELLPKPEKPSR